MLVEIEASLLVMNFFFGWNCPGAIDSIKFLERRLSPDTETSDVTTGGNFQQIQPVNINQRDAGYVTESPTNAVVLSVDDYWATALDTSSVSHFADTSTETSRILHLHTAQLNMVEGILLIKFEHLLQ